MQFLYVYCVHTPCIKSWGNNNRFFKSSLIWLWCWNLTASVMWSQKKGKNVSCISKRNCHILPQKRRRGGFHSGLLLFSGNGQDFCFDRFFDWRQLNFFHWWCFHCTDAVRCPILLGIALQQKLGQWIFFCVRLTHVYSTDLLHWHDGSASKVGFSMHAQDTKKENG